MHRDNPFNPNLWYIVIQSKENPNIEIFLQHPWDTLTNYMYSLSSATQILCYSSLTQAKQDKDEIVTLINDINNLSQISKRLHNQLNEKFKIKGSYGNFTTKL